MLTYSIAIRTLGTTGEKFRRELETIALQTVEPDRVCIYIADGYSRPTCQIGKEEYFWVRKGMVAQRALPYDEIKSDVILFLDDDVELSPDSAGKILETMVKFSADCVSADVFINHKMPFMTKFKAAISNLIFPHLSQKWAFKINSNGSYSYNLCPKRNFYWSQKCDGPVVAIKKEVYKKLFFEDELWLDSLGFSYGDDMVETYKIFRNGFKIGVMYNSGCKHLDGGSASSHYRTSDQRIYIRTKAIFMIWWRIIYQPASNVKFKKFFIVIVFGFKLFWLLLIFSLLSLKKLSVKPISLYIKGLKDGWNEVHSPSFINLRNYVIN